MTIKVIDAICGAGKTSYAIQHMNDNINKLFIYVTPFLKEIERIRENTIAEFEGPNARLGKGKKIEHVKSLVEQSSNIVMTHELFARLDEDILTMIKQSGYTLIMDEVANVLNQEKIAKDDMRMLVDTKRVVIEDDQVIWMDYLYEGSFSYLKVLSQRKNLFLHNGTILFWTMPVANFNSFEEVYILTYLFDGQIQRYYYDMHNLNYIKYSVVRNGKGRYELIEYNKFLEPRKEVEGLLNIYENYQRGTGRKSALNTNYLKNPSKKQSDNPRTALSNNWFKHAHQVQTDQLKNNLVSFFRTHCPTANDELFWTSPKSYAPVLKNKKTKLDKKDDRSKDNFVPFNIRATNDYNHRTATAFILNRFMNPNEKQFFEGRGVEVNEDMLAISDLIQFLFRGCIRNNEPMYCYIPSARMRRLLKQWISFEI